MIRTRKFRLAMLSVAAVVLSVTVASAQDCQMRAGQGRDSAAVANAKPRQKKLQASSPSFRDQFAAASDDGEGRCVAPREWPGPPAQAAQW